MARLATIDVMHTSARSFPESITSRQLIDYAREVERSGGPIVFVFHGVASDYLNVSTEAHCDLVDCSGLIVDI